MSQWYKNKWQDKVDVFCDDTKSALQLIYNSLNQGQQKKILKNEQVKALFDRYGVMTDGGET